MDGYRFCTSVHRRASCDNITSVRTEASVFADKFSFNNTMEVMNMAFASNNTIIS